MLVILLLVVVYIALLAIGYWWLEPDRRMSCRILIDIVGTYIQVERAHLSTCSTL